MSKRIFIFALIILVPHTSAVLDFTLSELVQSIENNTLELLTDIGNITSAKWEYTIKQTRNVLLGLPFEISLDVASEICSAVESIPPLEHRPKKEKIKLVLYTRLEKRSFALTELEQLLQNADFDVKKNIVIFVSGWTTDEDSPARRIMFEAYALRNNTNYLTLDSADYIRTLYFWSATNTDKIGEFLAESLADLRISIATEQFHLMGHSLGAQIVGAAARYYRDLTDETLPHVTGLDPAMPCFNEGEALSTISASDADFVDIIHTSPGVLGQLEATGTVDFYVGGKFPIQDNCLSIFCSHERSWQYYAESVRPGNEKMFMAKRCSSLLHYKEGRCDGIEQPMGYAVPHDINGQYYLEVNTEPPVGKNAITS